MRLRKLYFIVLMLLAVVLFGGIACVLINEILRIQFRAGITFMGIVTIGNLWLGFLIVNKLHERLRQETFVWTKVGTLPHQLPSWKWQAIAFPKAKDMLCSCARDLENLCQEEEQLLANPNPHTARALDFHREIERKMKEFWRMHAAFVSCKVTGLKSSWKEYK